MLSPARILLITLPILQSALAVTLYDFTPRVSNLPSACGTIYKSTIDGCQPSDFQTQKCSSECVSALDSLQKQVSQACSGLSLASNSVIGAFLAGSGTSDLCPNAPSDSSSPSSSVTEENSTKTSTQAQSTATPSINSSTMVANTATASTSGIMVDTSAMTQASTTSSATSSISSAVVIAQSTTSREAQSTTTAMSSVTVSPSPETSSITDSPSSSTSTVPTTLMFQTSSPTFTPSATSTSIGLPSQETSGGGGSPFDSYTSSAESLPRSSSIALLMFLSAFAMALR